MACETTHISKESERENHARRCLLQLWTPAAFSGTENVNGPLFARPFTDHAVHLEQMLAELLEREAECEEPLHGFAVHVAG
jgi:hypothetical protein